MSKRYFIEAVEDYIICPYRVIIYDEKDIHEHIWYSKHRSTISRRLIDIKNYCTELKKELY